MLKKIFLIVSSVILLGYIIFAIVWLNPRVGSDLVCQRIDVKVVDSLDRYYFSGKDILQILNRSNLNPVEKKMSDIKTDEIKKRLEESSLIKNVDCFKTVDGSIMIRIYQRIPILRVFSSERSYYVDSEGEIMGLPGNFTAYVPVATGHIKDDFAKNKLYPFASFLSENKFWNSQIEQIYVTANQEIELTPRVGDHQIVLGDIDHYKENLDKLKLFYEKALNKIGWNRYSVINLRYKNQVVCTKKEG